MKDILRLVLTEIIAYCKEFVSLIEDVKWILSMMEKALIKRRNRNDRNKSKRI